MSPTTATTLAAEHYGLPPTTAELLAGEVDLNYRLTTAGGANYTLKISRPGAAEAGIRFQYELLRHLATKDLPFAVPHPVGKLHRLADGRLLRCFTWVPGRMLEEVNPITPGVRQDWGRTAGHLTAALADFDHPDAPLSYVWNPSQTLACRSQATFTPARQRLADTFWDRFSAVVLPALPDLPTAINYNDAHQHNLLADASGNICGVIDFGDAMRTQRINELAIACAYAGMNTTDPLSAMADVVAGYTAVVRLTAPELAVLFDLAVGRLLITVTRAARNQELEPDNDYLQVSAAPAWALLEQLADVSPLFATRRLHLAAGLPVPQRALPLGHPVVDLAGKTVVPIDLSVGSLDLGNNANFESLPLFSRTVTRYREDHQADFAVGGYGETRPVYTTDDFVTGGNNGPRWRTVHLGYDVWGPAGTAVYAPLAATVHALGVDPTRGGYGNVVVLEHHDAEGLPFYTLYGHLSAASLAHLSVGDAVAAGDLLTRFGEPDENGGWPPHLHFQVMHDLLGLGLGFPGVSYPGQAETFLSFCPDPAPFFGRQPSRRSATAKHAIDSSALLASRKKHLGYSLSVSYAKPLTILRGYKQYLFADSGRRYLDTVNNVAHVGHEHPAVVRAARRQTAVLNTNSRYLHPNIVRFAEELVATLPPELSVVHFVNSGSEANELALRMSEQWSGTRNMLAVEVGYHGNTGRTIDISGYKFDGKGGRGAPPQTRLLPLPDLFRGRHAGEDGAGKTYGAYAGAIISELAAEGQQAGGFIAESILSCGGQIVLPQGYLREVYHHVRAAGGLCIADEVQVGLGRVGSHWWGFELQGVVPDIVTIGKPLGNGHPLAAVVCRPEVAANFANGMEYFNTFGGNPVSCAIGRAVLQTVREEGLRDNATAVGSYLTTQLRQLQEQHPLIGDVRGEGLFLGFELVTPASPTSPTPASAPHQPWAPATLQANYLKNRMRQLGFLMSTDGPDENVIKIKPPLCFTRGNADQLVGYLDRVLGEDAMVGE